jgi:hypothetical protein
VGALNDLRLFLNQLPSGAIENISAVERILASCWHELTQYDGGMEGYKLKGRMETVTWNAPLLRFAIERHGGTVMGSVYAEMQNWTVNTETAEASVERGRRRQVEAKEKPLKVGPIADELVRMIADHQNDPRLKWNSDSRVKVVIADVIPATNQQTTAGRRKRFWTALEQKLRPNGWTRVSSRSQFFQRISEG